MKRFTAPVFLLFSLMVFFSGCSNASRIIGTGLKIELTEIQRTSDGVITVSWHVANGNIVPYLFSRVDHKIYLDGTLVGQIEDDAPLAVPANTNTGRTAQLTKTESAASQVLTDAVARGSANYRVDTHMTILIYGETTEKTELTNSGSVPVRTK